MAESWVVKIENWLKEGKEESKTVLGIPWDTEAQHIQDHDIIVASHPKFFYSIRVLISKHFARLQIDPAITTDAIDVAERMKIYKKLLLINSELNQMKTGLYGSEDQIILSADLNLISLSKTEFNDALTALFMGSGRMIEELQLEEQLTAALMERNAAIIMEKLDQGWSKEGVLDFLMNRVGLEAEFAEHLVDNVMKMREAQTGQEAPEVTTPVKPAPDRMYG